MDIRDVKEKTPEIYDGSGLKQMFDLQQKLVDHYVKIEGLPEYPLDLHDKKHQLILKDFIARIIEELSEGFESYENMVELFEDGQQDSNEYMPHLYNLNEEIADAFHFMLETFLLCGIDENVIENEFGKMLAQQNLMPLYKKGDPLTTSFQYGKHLNQMQQLKPMVGWEIDIPKNLPCELLRGGRKVSVEIEKEMALLLWGITHNFNKSRNLLKNKPWKQSEMVTDKTRFLHFALDSWVWFFRFLDYIDVTTYSLFEAYYKKNQINQFRIKSKY